MNHLCQQCHCQVEKVSFRARGWWWKPSFEKLQSSFCFVFVFVFCRVEILPLVFYFLNSTICFPHHIHVFRYFFPYLVFLLVGDVICQLWTNYINIFAHTFCYERYFVDRKIWFSFPFGLCFNFHHFFFHYFPFVHFFPLREMQMLRAKYSKNWFIRFKLSLIQDQLIEG